MIPEFARISNSEIELMLKAPILVCILIAESSGGVLGLNKIGDEEARYVGLLMIKEPSR